MVDKPHFLPTTPRGMWYRSTALIRLREQYGEPDITPAHRLDRDTAGVVVFVREPRFRGAYQMLFQERRATKVYECVAPAKPITIPRYGTIASLCSPRVFPLLRRSRIIKDRGILQAYERPGSVNAETLIELGICCHSQDSARQADRGHLVHTANTRNTRRNCTGISSVEAAMPYPYACHSPLRTYVLHPRTGKTHQLRVHMNSLGLPIVGDPMYPQIKERAYDDFSCPLELVARSLEFIDPVTKEPRRFVSRISLGQPFSTEVDGNMPLIPGRE